MPPQNNTVTVNTPRGAVNVPADIAQSLGLTTPEPVAPVDSLIDAALNTPSTPQPLGGPGASAPIADAGDTFIPEFMGGEPPTSPEPSVTTPPAMPEGEQRFREILESRYGGDPNRVLDAAFDAQREEELAPFAEQVSGDSIEVDEVVEGAPIYQPEQRPQITVVPAMVRGPSGPAVVGRVTGVDRATRDRLIQTLRQVDPGGTDYAIVDGELYLGNNTTALLQNQGVLPPGQLLGLQAAGVRTVFPEQETPTPSGILVGEEVSLTERAPIPDAVTAAFSAANEKLEALRQESLAGRLDLNRLGAEGVTALAALRDQQIADMEAADTAGAQQLRNKLTQLDNTLEAIAANRVDPDAFFGDGSGGFGRRLGAAIAIALGGLAQGIMGGPNVGLATIRQRIEDNVRAQEANLANQRSVAGMQSNAISYFRQLLGDERAAREAAMAGQYEAAVNRLRGTLANAQSPVLRANGNALIVAARAEQLRHLMNAYQGAWEIERKWRVQTRTQQNPLTQMSQQARAAARAPVSTPPRTAQETARDMIERSARGEPLGIAPGVREPSRGRRQRPRVQAPPSSQEQRQEGVLPIDLSSFADPENTRLEAGMRLEQGQFTTPGQEPLPTMLEEINPGQWNRLPDSRKTTLRELTSGYARLEANLPRLIELARQGISIIPGEARGEAATLLEDSMAGLRAVWNFGSLTHGERPFLENIVQDPTAVTLSNIISDNPARLLGSLRAIRRSQAAQLRNEGFIIRDLRLVTERQEAEREQLQRQSRTRRREASHRQAETRERVNNLLNFLQEEEQRLSGSR